MQDADIILILAPPFWVKLPPLGLAYLSTFLNSRGYRPAVIDFNIELYRLASPDLKSKWHTPSNYKFKNKVFETLYPQFQDEIEELIEKIALSKAKLIGFSLFHHNQNFSFNLAQRIKMASPEKILIFGGPECLANYHWGFKLFGEDFPCVNDFYILGEGEWPLWRLLQRQVEISDKVLWRQEFENLDQIPFPSFEEFSLADYERQGGLSILASRGCIRRCHFCSERLLSEKFRMRPPEHIVAEIEHHKFKYGITWLSFHDSLINGDLEKLEKLCDLLIARKLNINWEAQAAIRTDMSLDLLSKMKQAGCYNLFVGLESGSDKVLHLMNKGYNSKEASDFFKCAHKADLHFEISLIVDFPGEGEREFLETLRFLETNATYIPKIAQLNPFVAYLPGLGLAEPFAFSPSSGQKVERLNSFFKEKKIKFTEAYINNLLG